MSNIQLANNLRYLRKKHGLTQKALSKMLNISRQAYSNYETGKRTPDLDSLLFLACCYRVSLDALVLKNLPGARRHPEELSVSPVSYILAKRQKNRRRHLSLPGGSGNNPDVPLHLSRKTDGWSPAFSLITDSLNH